MKVLSFTTHRLGNYKVREEMPFRAFAKNGHEGAGITPGTFDINKWDVFMLTRGFVGDFMSIVTPLKLYKKPMIYETDDAFDLVNQDSMLFNMVQKSLPAYYTFLQEANAITTTTEYLATHLRTLTRKPVFVLPNCVDPLEWEDRPRNHKKLRIGFAGSNTHLKDLNIVLPAIMRLQEKHDFTFVLMGVIDRKNPDEMLPIWTEIAKGKIGMEEFVSEAAKFIENVKSMKDVELNPGVPFYAFTDALSLLDLDIGIIPVVDNKFNKCRSPLKFYEYAMAGTLAIASWQTPYQEEMNGIWLAADDEWEQVLERYIVDKELREKEAAIQKKQVLANNSIWNNWQKWIEVYDGILKK